jgi:hypothetical protein
MRNASWTRSSHIRRASDVREDPVDQLPEPTSLLPQPDAIAEWEARHDMLQLVKKLPCRQRQVLAWTLSSYTPSEIAEQLGLTSEAVRASLKKARRAHEPDVSPFGAVPEVVRIDRGLEFATGAVKKVLGGLAVVMHRLPAFTPPSPERSPTTSGDPPWRPPPPTAAARRSGRAPP